MKIKELYPSLSWEHVRSLALTVATERNAATDITKVYSKQRWGVGCLLCQVVKDKIHDLDKSGEYPWLKYLPEIGMAYTVVVDGAPLRIQPDIDEIRGVMSNELGTIQAARPTQATLFSTDALYPMQRDELILRLEITQQPAKHVDLIALYLFDAHSGTTLDREVVYDVAPSQVISLTRSAQDVDLGGMFAFHADNDQGAKDGGE